MQRFRFIIIIGFGLIISNLLIGVSVASAHVLKTDGSIGAVMHIDPDDDPIANQAATFFFEFKDKKNKFDINQCTCQANITRAGQSQNLFSSSLNNNNIGVASFSYTFPERAVYTVTVTGQPKASANFQAFQLSYDVRVDRQAAATAKALTSNLPSPHLVHYILFGAAFGIVGFMYLRDKWRLKNAKKKQATRGVDLGIFLLVFGLAISQGHLAHAFCNPKDSPAAQHYQCCLPGPAEQAKVPLTAQIVIHRQELSYELPSYDSHIFAQKINNKSPPA